MKAGSQAILKQIPKHRVLHERPKSETLSLQSTSFRGGYNHCEYPLDESPLRFKPANYVAGLQDYGLQKGGMLLMRFSLGALCSSIAHKAESKSLTHL